MPGGEVRTGELTMTGPLAQTSLAALRFDTAILGCCGLSAADGLTAYDLPDAAVKRAAIASARRTIVVTDGSKFTRTALATVAPASSWTWWLPTRPPRPHSSRRWPPPAPPCGKCEADARADRRGLRPVRRHRLRTIGHVKPEPAAFDWCIRILGVEPARILFVDDREENVRAARACGMQGHLFTDAATLAQQLDMPSDLAD